MGFMAHRLYFSLTCYLLWDMLGFLTLYMTQKITPFLEYFYEYKTHFFHKKKAFNNEAALLLFFNK